MRYVIKCHIECESELKAKDLEQEIHSTLYEQYRHEVRDVKIDEENTFVVATDYDEYNNPNNIE